MGNFKLTKDQELEVVKRYKNGESIRKISLDCLVGRTSIGYVLKRYNVTRRSPGNSYNLRKYTLNESYFECIDTPEKAYWLGFISADGHVSDDGVTICLQEKDVLHLDKFLVSIGSNAHVSYRKKSKAFVANIWSKKIVLDLRKLKFYRRKSETQTFPEINDNLYSHFLRGLFDGDGCINDVMIEFTGSNDCINKIKEILMSKFLLNDSKVWNRGKFLHGVRWSKNRIQILDYLYNEATVYLDRKYEKYINYSRKCR